MMLVVNKTPVVFDPEAIARRVEETYGCPVAAVLPHSDDLMVLSSEGVFSLRYPEHPLTRLYRASRSSSAPMTLDAFDGLLDREQLLGGPPTRRAATLLFLIETRTTRLSALDRRRLERTGTDVSAEERALEFVEAFAVVRESAVQPSVQDLERQAVRWASARAEQPAPSGGSGAAARREVPVHRPGRARHHGRRSASTTAEVREAFQALYGEPIEAVFASPPDVESACAGRGHGSPSGSRACPLSGWRTPSPLPRRWAGRSSRCRSRSPSSARFRAWRSSPPSGSSTW